MALRSEIHSQESKIHGRCDTIIIIIKKRLQRAGDSIKTYELNICQSCRKFVNVILFCVITSLATSQRQSKRIWMTVDFMYYSGQLIHLIWTTSKKCRMEYHEDRTLKNLLETLKKVAVHLDVSYFVKIAESSQNGRRWYCSEKGTWSSDPCIIRQERFTFYSPSIASVTFASAV